MRREAVSGIMLTLLLTGMLTLAFNIQPVEASGTIYIRADGSVEPDTAPISSVDNVTYTFTSNINKTIVVERNNTIINGNGYTLQGNGTGYGCGFHIFEKANITIMNTCIKGFGIGIMIDVEYGRAPRHNAIRNNTITDNMYGIFMDSQSRASIVDNTITRNKVGIYMRFIKLTSIVYNNIKNNDEGIHMDGGCDHNNVTNNDITSNGCGIDMWGCGGFYYNNIVKNRIAFNHWGIYIWGGIENAIFHNIFIHNLWHAVPDGCISAWDDGYPSGGNYWSDYDGIDIYSGHYQNETGSDGIGDTPYVISEYDEYDNQDRYPLIVPYVPPIQVITATLDICPDTLNLRCNGKWVLCHIELPKAYSVSDIDVSTVMLNSFIPVDLTAPMEVGDSDNDTIQDLTVRFNRTKIMKHILSKGIAHGSVTLTLIGKLKKTLAFRGNNTILVSSLIGDVNCDGAVDLFDAVMMLISYGCREGEPCWNPDADLAPQYGVINLYDAVTMAYHYGQTYP